jgi:hypothetical protein
MTFQQRKTNWLGHAQRLCTVLQIDSQLLGVGRVPERASLRLPPGLTRPAPTPSHVVTGAAVEPDPTTVLAG